jgi:ABC-type sugar transport system ATPase subunit
MVLFGKPHPGALADAMRAGLGYIPDDRKTAGLFLDRSIADNVVAADLPSVTRSGLVSSAAVATAGRDAIRDFAVRAAGPAQRISQLSGGNQQKVLMAKWLRRNPKLLVVDEPTRGVDVGSKQEVHDMLRALAGRGAGVLVGSSDLPEILMIADRIVVLHRGRVAGVLAAADADEHRVVALASGLGQPLAEAS